jgi:hypothetical protein
VLDLLVEVVVLDLLAVVAAAFGVAIAEGLSAVVLPVEGQSVEVESVEAEIVAAELQVGE